MLCFCFHPKWVDFHPLPTLRMQSECQTPAYIRFSPQQYSPYPLPLRPAVLGCTQAICASNQLATNSWFRHLVRFISFTEQLRECRQDSTILRIRVLLRRMQKETHRANSERVLDTELPCSRPHEVRVRHPPDTALWSRIRKFTELWCPKILMGFN